MNTENPENKKPAKVAPFLLIALAIALIMGVAWFVSKNKEASLPPLQSEQTNEQIQNTVQEQPAAEQEPVVETQETTTAMVVDPASVDVAKAMSVRSIGNKEAPIKIYEYASLTCSHCAHFHNDIFPALKEKYIDTGKVYFEFRDFPLNDPALKAVITARCLPEDKYVPFIGLLFKTQDQWASGVSYMPSLKQNSKLAGLSEGAFEACQENNDIKLKIADSMKQAQEKWKIEATPTFIINDGQETISGAVPLEEFERVFRKVSNDSIGQAPAVK